MTATTDAFIFDGLRSAFGRQGGVLSRIRPDDLLGQVIRALMAKTGVDPTAIEDVLAGCACQAGEDARNVARHGALMGGLPVEVAAQTVNRLCGSGMAAVIDASRAIRLGDGELMIAGGVESMTRAPFVVAKSEQAFGRDFKVYDSAIGARFPNPKVIAAYGGDTMPETADNIARDLAIGREESDAFAARSQASYEAARAAGFFEGEITAVTVDQGRKAPALEVTADEHPRPDSTLAALTKLRPLAADGVVTAGNASGINDGAAALLLGTEAAGARFGLKPRARIVAAAVAGVEPRVMGLGPVPAARKALARAGLSLADMDVIEINEAFATQVLGCLKQLDLAYDDARVNPNGGAIAVGHPLGASGARITLTALRELERRGGRYALVSMCIGIGQGIALIVERV
ncbi:MAG: acetyl-CoA C-acyltransferase [Tistrella sp.]|uniref:acetyl-CoA C-acyltransferase n=1 Tax=Tistrella mobilis TaxID=171437 RepID=A0A3B9IUX2_9PROT|nr:3-oxoadipyl-CoA thiolase [Tistrella sp.]MAD39824.1 acetyl-CoA C-acyltransferase [Tistrella sp.]MBA74378.1 acetyl-CoA C-acyltransferase [Tistrella sp.]HAE51614.1 3-oxoadipyl-CoA thiolase [Tistrella mobilis]|tara:strand:+ start:65 stop:1276 length:1212 start_codon:yes stop_codon:yes gene_type:complete